MRASHNTSAPSRSDELRKKRTQNTQERVSKVRKSASRAPRSQPVVIRGGFTSAAVPLRQPKGAKLRKQYYYSMGASGAEIRLPAIPLIKPGARLISFALFVLTALAIYMISFSQEFEIASYKIEGIQRLTYADFEAVLGLEGTPVVTLNNQTAVEKLAAAFPELASIEMVVGFPAEVNFNVIERQPVLAWLGGEKTYWLDQAGYFLPPRGDAGELLFVEADGLPPLLPGSTPSELDRQNPDPLTIWGQQSDPIILTVVFDLSGRLPSDSKLVYNSLNGLGWIDPHGWDVFIGRDLENFEQKLVIYESIVANFEREGIYPSEMVSVEFINAPFFK
jgi:hypothetical protein